MSSSTLRWAVACAALAFCATFADSAPETVWDHASPSSRFETATAQGGRGQHLDMESTKLESSSKLDSTNVSVDDAYDTSQFADWRDTRDVRTRPTPRVRDANSDILARILSLTAGLPRDAMETVRGAVAVARSANELGAILGDLTAAASDTFRDELYWRGEGGEGTTHVEGQLEGSLANVAETNRDSSGGSSSGVSFRGLGPFSVKRTEVTFYWPSLGFAGTQRQSPFVNAVVFTPDAIENETHEPGFGGTARRFNGSQNVSGSRQKYPALAFSIGWNSWTERYEKTLAHLASHGFVVVAPTVADRKVRPLFAFERLSDHLRACLGWVVRETNRRNSDLFGTVDVTSLGMFGHSSGAGAAIKATVDAKRFNVPGSSQGSANGNDANDRNQNFEDIETVQAIVGRNIRAVAGLGAFLESSGLQHDDLGNLRDVSLFQLAGRRDSHVTPRQIADIAAAAVHAVPRAVGVLRYGTHCFLDEEDEYPYPDSQCTAALAGYERYSLTNPRDAPVTSSSSSLWSGGSLFSAGSYGSSAAASWGDNGDDDFADDDENDGNENDDAALVMSPLNQQSATREWLTTFFTAELRGGELGSDAGDAIDETSANEYEKTCAREARRKMWGMENDSGMKKDRQTHSGLANGGRGGFRGSGELKLELKARSPIEETGLESFGVPPEFDVTLSQDPRMSRVEVLAWTG